MCMTKSRPSGIPVCKLTLLRDWISSGLTGAMIWFKQLFGLRYWISNRGRRMTLDEMLKLQGTTRCFKQVGKCYSVMSWGRHSIWTYGCCMFVDSCATKNRINMYQRHFIPLISMTECRWFLTRHLGLKLAMPWARTYWSLSNVAKAPVCSGSWHCQFEPLVDHQLVGFSTYDLLVLLVVVLSTFVSRCSPIQILIGHQDSNHFQRIGRALNPGPPLVIRTFNLSQTQTFWKRDAAWWMVFWSSEVCGRHMQTHLFCFSDVYCSCFMLSCGFLPFGFLFLFLLPIWVLLIFHDLQLSVQPLQPHLVFFSLGKKGLWWPIWSLSHLALDTQSSSEKLHCTTTTTWNGYSKMTDNMNAQLMHSPLGFQPNVSHQPKTQGPKIVKHGEISL